MGFTNSELILIKGAIESKINRLNVNQFFSTVAYDKLLRKVRMMLGEGMEIASEDGKKTTQENIDNIFNSISNARTRGDGCEICIDGFIEADGGRIRCDCKLVQS